MLTESEIVAILRRERDRWLRQEDDSSAGIVLGAVGALSNVLAEIERGGGVSQKLMEVKRRHAGARRKKEGGK